MIPDLMHAEALAVPVMFGGQSFQIVPPTHRKATPWRLRLGRYLDDHELAPIILKIVEARQAGRETKLDPADGALLLEHSDRLHDFTCELAEWDLETRERIDKLISSDEEIFTAFFLAVLLGNRFGAPIQKMTTVAASNGVQHTTAEEPSLLESGEKTITPAISTSP